MTDEDKVNQMNNQIYTPRGSAGKPQPRASELAILSHNFDNENAVQAVDVSPSHKLKDNDTSIEVEKITDTSARLSGGINLQILIQQNLGINNSTGPMNNNIFDEGCDVFKNSFEHLNNNSGQNMIIESNDESFQSMGRANKATQNILKIEEDQNIILEVEGEMNNKIENNFEDGKEPNSLILNKPESEEERHNCEPHAQDGSSRQVHHEFYRESASQVLASPQRGANGYICSIDNCGKAFQFKSEFERHMKVHSKDLPYKCSLCPKAFKRLDNYKVHQRIHTDERPYVCREDNCGERFRTKAALNYHVRKHQKDFLCEEKGCYKAFSCEAELTKHLKSKHIFLFDAEYDEEVKKKKEVTLEELKRVEKMKASVVFTQAKTEEMLMEKEMKKKKFSDFSVLDSVLFAEDYLKSKDMKEKALHELITKKKHRKKKTIDDQDQGYDFLEVIAKKIDSPSNDACGKSKVNEQKLYQKICQLYSENKELKKKVKYFEGLGRAND